MTEQTYVPCDTALGALAFAGYYMEVLEKPQPLNAGRGVSVEREIAADEVVHQVRKARAHGAPEWAIEDALS